MKKILIALILSTFALPLFSAEPSFTLIGKEPAKLDSKVFAILGKQKKEVVVEKVKPVEVQVKEEPVVETITPVQATVTVPVVNNNPWQWNPTTRTWWRYETPTVTTTQYYNCGPNGCTLRK